MKKILVLSMAICLGFSIAQAKEKKEKKGKETTVVLANNNDSLNYMLGMIFGRELNNTYITINYDVFLQGVKDISMGKDTLIKKEDFNRLMNQLQATMMAKDNEKKAIEATKAKEQGIKFLEENKLKPGVVTLPSGLQYKVLKEGTGASPLATDKVKVHYHGVLTNGTVFDSSVERGEPISFALNQVIPGWTEGVQLMKEGAVYELYIPANLAYGSNPVGSIPAESTLIFTVELIQIEK